MKSKIVLGTVFVATCVLCAVIGYRAGAHRANQVPRNVATELPSRVYFNLMAALEDLRMGRLERGTRKVEAVCFASAAINLPLDPNLDRAGQLPGVAATDLYHVSVDAEAAAARPPLHALGDVSHDGCSGVVPSR